MSGCVSPAGIRYWDISSGKIFPAAISRSAVTASLLRDSFTVLSHAFDRHLYEEKPVFDAFLTVFNGDACHSAASKKDGLLPIS